MGNSSAKSNKPHTFQLPNFKYYHHNLGAIFTMINGKYNCTTLFEDKQFQLSEPAIGYLDTNCIVLAGGINTRTNQLCSKVQITRLDREIVQQFTPLPVPAKIGDLHRWGKFLVYAGGLYGGGDGKDYKPLPIMIYDLDIHKWVECNYKQSNPAFDIRKLTQYGSFIINDQLYILGGYYNGIASKSIVAMSLVTYEVRQLPIMLRSYLIQPKCLYIGHGVFSICSGYEITHTIARENRHVFFYNLHLGFFKKIEIDVMQHTEYPMIQLSHYILSVYFPYVVYINLRYFNYDVGMISSTNNNQAGTYKSNSINEHQPSFLEDYDDVSDPGEDQPKVNFIPNCITLVQIPKMTFLQQANGDSAISMDESFSMNEESFTVGGQLFTQNESRNSTMVEFSGHQAATISHFPILSKNSLPDDTLPGLDYVESRPLERILKQNRLERMERLSQSLYSSNSARSAYSITMLPLPVSPYTDEDQRTPDFSYFLDHSNGEETHMSTLDDSDVDNMNFSIPSEVNYFRPSLDFNDEEPTFRESDTLNLQRNISRGKHVFMPYKPAVTVDMR